MIRFICSMAVATFWFFALCILQVAYRWTPLAVSVAFLLSLGFLRGDRRRPAGA